MKKNKIEISTHDFGTLCICALRYCHGRRTYMPSTVQEIVKAHFEDLSEQDINIILKDKEFQGQMCLWGDECDKKNWESFYSSVEDYSKQNF